MFSKAYSRAHSLECAKSCAAFLTVTNVLAIFGRVPAAFSPPLDGYAGLEHLLFQCTQVQRNLDTINNRCMMWLSYIPEHHRIPASSSSLLYMHLSRRQLRTRTRMISQFVFDLECALGHSGQRYMILRVLVYGYPNIKA